MSKNNHRTPAQQTASRTNGAKSQGPTSPEGKATSSQNAIKHGLRSKRDVLANESQQEYDSLLAAYTREWNPSGQTERDILARLVSAEWRCRRIRAMNDCMIDTEMFIVKEDFEAAFDPITPVMRQADAVLSVAAGTPGALEYFRRTEVSLSRSIHRAKKELIEMQTIRLGQTPQINPQQPSVPAEEMNSADEPTESSGESDEISNKSSDFAWISTFTAIPRRPTTDRGAWKSPAPHPSEDKPA